LRGSFSLGSPRGKEPRAGRPVPRGGVELHAPEGRFVSLTAGELLIGRGKGRGGHADGSRLSPIGEGGHRRRRRCGDRHFYPRNPGLRGSFSLGSPRGKEPRAGRPVPRGGVELHAPEGRFVPLTAGELLIGRGKGRGGHADGSRLSPIGEGGHRRRRRCGDRHFYPRNPGLRGSFSLGSPRGKEPRAGRPVSRGGVELRGQGIPSGFHQIRRKILEGKGELRGPFGFFRHRRGRPHHRAGDTPRQGHPGGMRAHRDPQVPGERFGGGGRALPPGVPGVVPRSGRKGRGGPGKRDLREFSFSRGVKKSGQQRGAPELRPRGFRVRGGRRRARRDPHGKRCPHQGQHGVKR
ncbi:MAG TPA: hypothetical protein PL162_04225, partial [Synergistaceae bacterium]|nr:hypothetical protein [Synergistaceae bacterium]